MTISRTQNRAISAMWGFLIRQVGEGGLEVGASQAVAKGMRVGGEMVPFGVAEHRCICLQSLEVNDPWLGLAYPHKRARKGKQRTGACIAMIRDGMLATPTATNSILESLTRHTSITLLRELEHTIIKCDVDRTELYLAGEIFFMGTGWEILPVTWRGGSR